MALTHLPCVVNLAVHHHQTPLSARLVMGSNAQTVTQVRRPIAARQAAVAHGAEHDDRLVAAPQEINEEGHLLQGIRAGGHDQPACSLIDQLAEPADERRQGPGIEGGRGQRRPCHQPGAGKIGRRPAGFTDHLCHEGGLCRWRNTALRVGYAGDRAPQSHDGDGSRARHDLAGPRCAERSGDRCARGK